MSSALRETGKVVSYAVRAVAALHMFSMNAYEFSSTSGDSMLPTLQVSKDYAIVDKSHKFGRDCHMGDVIVARKPNAPSNWVCKRITGMPGDIILIDPSENTLRSLETPDDDDDDDEENATSNGTNGIKEVRTAEEIQRKKNYNNYVIVPEGHVWVTGDNLTDSVDSRTYSVLPMGLISGKLKYAWYIPSILAFKDQYFRELDSNYEEY